MGKITHRFPILDGRTVEVWEWTNNFIPIYNLSIFNFNFKNSLFDIIEDNTVV